ncbi:MAG: hypothetical protein ACJ709_06285 [Nitrososphaeraceae archaeon]
MFSVLAALGKAAATLAVPILYQVHEEKIGIINKFVTEKREENAVNVFLSTFLQELLV